MLFDSSLLLLLMGEEEVLFSLVEVG